MRLAPGGHAVQQRAWRWVETLRLGCERIRGSSASPAPTPRNGAYGTPTPLTSASKAASSDYSRLENRGPLATCGKPNSGVSGYTTSATAAPDTAVYSDAASLRMISPVGSHVSGSTSV